MLTLQPQMMVEQVFNLLMPKRLYGLETRAAFTPTHDPTPSVPPTACAVRLSSCKVTICPEQFEATVKEPRGVSTVRGEV